MEDLCESCGSEVAEYTVDDNGQFVKLGKSCYEEWSSQRKNGHPEAEPEENDLEDEARAAEAEANFEDGQQEKKNETTGCTVLWNDNKDHPYGGDEYAFVVLPNGKGMPVRILAKPGEW